MDYVRMTIAEAAYAFIAGDLPTGETVKVTTFFDMKSATSPVLTTNTATEIGATGKYYWCLDELQAAPAAEMIVLWIMTAPVSGRTTWGVLHIGGYPGTLLDGAIKTTSFAAGAIDAAAIKDAAIDLATFAADVKTGSALKANVETISANAITAAAINNGAITGDKVDATAVVKIVGTAVALDGGAASVCGMLTKMADDNGGADFDATRDSQNKIAVALQTVDANVDDVLEDTGTTLPGTLTTIESKIDTVDGVADAVKLKTDGLNFTGTDVKATLDGEEVDLSSDALDNINAEALIARFQKAPVG